MQKYLIITVIVLLGVIGAGWKQLKNVTEKWEIAEANVKAYSQELSGAKEKNTAFQLTVAQLKNSQDSIFEELNKTRKDLGIKDSKLKALQYVASQFARKDTVLLSDTVFKEPAFALDTIIGDHWYHVKLGLKYPSMITVEPELESKKHIIIANKKETINPPKKFFLFRWFQRKHIVLHVDIVEQNPYITNGTSRYVEIIK